jgi:hypothetical protein
MGTLEEIKEANIYRDYSMPKSVEVHNAWARWDDTFAETTCASADGQFVIPNRAIHALPHVRRCLLVTANGYVAQEVGPVEATREPDPSQLTIRLQRGKRILGVVTDSKSGKPIEGAWVTYFNSTQPYTIDDEILPQRIPTGKRILPLGSKTVCTNKDGEYEITTAQTDDNYLVINAPGYNSGISTSYAEKITCSMLHPPEYVPMVVGPVEVISDELFLPILFKLQKSDSKAE